MQRKLIRIAALSLVTLGAGCLGCDGEPLLQFNRTGGNSIDGFFLIDPLENVASGAKLDVAVRDFEGSQGFANPGRARNATSNAPDLLTVAPAENGKLTLTGLAPGDVRVDFDGVADQEELRDGFQLKVIEPKRIFLNPCSDGVYLRGAPALISFHFTDGPPESAHNRAQGYGLYPLAITGEATINLGHRDPFTVRVDIAENAGASVELRSTLPDDPNNAQLPLIDPKEVTSISIVDKDAFSGAIRPGTLRQLGLEIMAGQQRVCSAVEVEVREKSPDTCQVVRSDLDPMMLAMLAKGGARVAPLVLLSAATSLAIRAIEDGVCELEFAILSAGIEIAKTLTFKSTVSTPRRSSSGGGGGDD